MEEVRQGGEVRDLGDDDLIDADQDDAQAAAPPIPVVDSRLRLFLVPYVVVGGGDGPVVDSGGEDDIEDRNPLEVDIDIIYEDIAKLAVVIADPELEWTVDHLATLYEVAEEASTTLADKKTAQKAANKQIFRRDRNRYDTNYFSLVKSMQLINTKRNLIRKRETEREKERDRREAVEHVRREAAAARDLADEIEERADRALAEADAAAGREPAAERPRRRDPAGATAERDYITDRMMEEMSELRLRLMELESERRAPTPAERPYGSERGRSSGKDKEFNQPRIKAITCPQFKGEYIKFNSFRTTFENLYGRENMSKIDLAMRLHEHLEGEPKKKVQNLYQHNLDKHCYAKMWHELEKIYGGDEVITSEMITLAVMMKPFRTLDPKEIEEFYDCFKKQYEFWERSSPSVIRDPKNATYHLIRYKIAPTLAVKYDTFCKVRKYNPNMVALLRWIDEIYQKFIVTAKESENRTKLQRIHSEAAKNVPRLRPSWDKPQKEKPTKIEVKAARVEETEEDDYDYSSDQDTLCEGDSDEEVTITKAQLRTFRRTPFLAKKTGCQDCINLKHTPPDCEAFKKLTAIQRSVFIRNSGICFHCLTGKHLVRDCKVKEGEKCAIDGCDRYHHHLLHSLKTAHAIMHAQFPEAEEEQELLLGSSYSTEKGRSNMQTLVAYLEGTNEPKKVICMLDTGSNVSCIDENLAKELGAQPLTPKGKQFIKYLDRKVPVETQMVRILITDLSKGARFTMDAWTIPNLSKGTRAVDWSDEKKRWPHLTHIDFPELPDDKRINFLIGHIYSDFFVPLEFARGPEFMQPLGVKTPYGWTVLGGTKRKANLLDALKVIKKVDIECWKQVFSKAVRILRGN